MIFQDWLDKLTCMSCMTPGLASADELGSFNQDMTSFAVVNRLTQLTASQSFLDHS